MGASNVAAAFAKYAGKIPPLSMVCLAYMALVSKDADMNPWFGQGHAALAQGALGRQMPIDRADIKAVERAIKPLLNLQPPAITTERRASGRRTTGHATVRYRLNLAFVLDLDMPRSPASPPPRVPRNSGDEPAPRIDQSPVDNRANAAPSSPGIRPHRPPETVPIVPRKPGTASPTNRGTEEYEETQEELEEDYSLDLHTDVTAARAHDPGCAHGFVLVDDQLTYCQCRKDPPCPATSPAAPINTAHPAAASSAPANAKADPTRTRRRSRRHHRPAPAQNPSPPAPTATPQPSQENPTPASTDPANPIGEHAA